MSATPDRSHRPEPPPRRSDPSALLRVACAILVVGLAPRLARAATCTWQSSSGANWNAATSNWSCGAFPGSGDDVVFSSSGTGTCTINTSISVNSMSLNSGAGTVIQSSSGTITIAGSYSQSAGTFTGASSGTPAITVKGNFSVSGGSFTSTPGLLTVSGAFTGNSSFNGGSGTVLLNSTSSQNLATNNARFNNLSINDGLVAYWKLDEATGTTAADASGYGNTGTLSATAPTWITSGLPGLNFSDAAGLSFNGSTNYVSLGTNGLPAVNAAQTISLWAKLSSTSGQQNLVVLENGSSAAVQIEINNGNFGAYNWGGGTLVATTAPSTGVWHHIVYTYDGAGHQTLYIDGTATTASVTNQTGTVTSAYFGTYAPNNQMFNGSLDDVRIYNRVLAATEVDALASGYQPATYVATQTMTGSMTVNGDFTLASGFLAMGANTISLAGSWWNHGGQLSATYWGAAAISLTGTATTNVIRSGGQFLPSLTITGSGKWTLDDNLDVDPNAAVTLSAGTLDISSRTLRTGNLASSNGALTSTGATVILNGATNHTVGAASQNNLRIEDASENNLVGYWKFDETQGNSARDWTGNGHTATLVNGPTWTNTVPSTVEFYDPSAVSLTSGSSQYVDAGGSLVSTNAAFSTCGWVNFASVSAWNAVISFNGTNVAVFTLQRDNAGPFSLDMRSSDSTGATLYHLVGSTTVATGTWYHVCGVFDGSKSHLYVNGTEEGTAQTISSTWNASGHLTIGANVFSAALADYTSGTIDDVRLYNVALTAAQVTQLAKGRYANTGGTATFTLAGSVTAGGAVNVDSGTLNPGSSTLTATGGLTVHNAGTLKLDTTNGAIALGSGSTLTVDGTLSASNANASIKSSSGTYAFKVGSTSTATPTLTISGLTVKNTDANGMWIGANTSATTTITQFDKVAFSSGTSGGELLQIYAKSLYLSSVGCSFDANNNASTTYSVKLTGNGTSDGETRVVFGGATCALNVSSCQATKSDDDSDNDGVGNTPASNGAVVQFIRSVADDTAGSIVGFPTAAFDWSTFSYYSTYVAFHNASSGTTDVVYVRDETGAARYSWTVPTSGETITGTPQWTTVSSKHYVFVATSAGKVYRLVDSGTGLAPDTGGAWSTNPFNCSCTISTPLAMDANNLYWGSTTSGKNFWTLGISNESNPTPVAITPAVTNTALAIATVSGTSYAFMGVTGNILKISTAGQVISATNSSPGSASVWGRIIVGYNKSGTTRVYAGDDGGTMWAIDSGSGFATANGLWHYTTSNAIKSSPYYDHDTDTVQYGTQAGTIIVLGGTGSVLNSSYPYTPSGGSGDPITAAPLYYSGVLLVGSTGGKLYFLDRNTGTTPAVSIIKEYAFGSSESVSSIGYDPSVNRYMVTTSNSSANDGRIYFFDQVSDPTPGSL